MLSVMAACVSSAAAFTLPMLAAPVHGAFLGHSHARLASRCLRPGLKPQRPSPTLSLSASLAGVFDRNFAKSVADQVVSSVAMVTPRGVRNITSRGTAFVVAFGAGDAECVYLLTAAHVASPGQTIEVSFVGATGAPQRGKGRPATIAAEVVGRAGDADVALIKVKRGDVEACPAAAHAAARPLALRLEAPSLGELAFSCGFAGGLRGPAMTLGIVSGVSDAFAETRRRRGDANSTDATNGSSTDSAAAASNGSSTESKGAEVPEASEELEEAEEEGDNFRPFRYVVTDAGMAGGMSGGPLVDTEGAVLGINCLVRPELRSLGNYAVSAGVCQELLDRLAVGTDKAKSELQSIRVMLFNDPFNTRARVSKALAEVAMLTEAEAEVAMMSAHTKGRGVVKVFDKKEEFEGSAVAAELLCQALRAADLLVEVEELFAPL